MLGPGVRAQRNDEVVQAVAGVVRHNDNGPVWPVVVLRAVVAAVVTLLSKDGGIRGGGGN